MKQSALVLFAIAICVLVTWGEGPQGDEAGPGATAEKTTWVKGRAASKSAAEGTARSSRSTHLLDRGTAGGPPRRGGGPATPLPIAYPGGGPSAMAAGIPAGAGAFPLTGLGGYYGNIFAPGVGYPPGFLTGGSTPGFVITGAYAWNSPFVKTGPVTGVPGGSPVRILGAAAAPVPPTPMAAVLAPPGAFTFFTTTAAPGPPGPPPGIVGGPGIFTPGVAILPTGTPAPSAAFCGFLAGGPGFTTSGPFPPGTGWTGNGLGASLPPMGPGVPLRVAFFGPPFLPPGTFLTISASPIPTPQDFIAGCFAAGATTPVELMAFGVE